MRAVSLHPDVIVVTSALLHVNCVIVRAADAGAGLRSEGASQNGETFVIDSPVLPDELDALHTLTEQARFPAPSGLLATHGDWDHLLGRLAFPGLALGCAESTAARLMRSPGEAQRELRAFDDELYIERAGPLALGEVQALPIPGRCGLGELELELYQADGHTADGMAVWVPWAQVLVAGDYLSNIELPVLGDGADVTAYLATLERLRPLLEQAAYVVPGHGPAIEGSRASELLEDDARYLRGLAEHGLGAQLPAGRRSPHQRTLHAENAARIATR